MDELNVNSLIDHHKKILNVNNHPYGHCTTKKFLPEEVIKSISSSFKFPDQINSTSDVLFQKTKKALNEYNLFPPEIKKIIDYLNSKNFISILEDKFKINNLMADPSLFGGGMHESRNGGYLKIHSDFIYIRKKKLKRMLNLLLYLNDNWDEEWGGAIELWDQKMESNFVKVFPKINNAVIFRTDTESNHGFPDPITCPKTIGRKSLALYYYIYDNSLFKRTKYFYARWKRRPGIDEPKFGDNRNFLERFKNSFLFRFK